MARGKKTTKIKQSPKLPAETRRQQLLDAAESLFRKQGFRATTTVAIARRAGLTKGALYFHFKSKRDIAFELVKRAAGRALADVEARVHPGIKMEEIFEILTQAETKGHLDYYRQSLDFRHHAHKMPAILSFGRQTHSRVVDILASNLDHVYGRTGTQRRQAAIMILSFYEGLIAMRRINREIVDIETQIKLFESLYRKRRMSSSR